MKKKLILSEKELGFDPKKIQNINRVDVIDDKGIKLKIEFEVGK